VVSSSFLFLLQYIYKHISASIQGFACFDFQTQLPPSDFSSTSRRQASTSSASFMVSHAHCHLSYTLLNPLCTNHRLHPSPGSRQSHAAYSHFRWPCPSMTVSLLTLSSATRLLWTTSFSLKSSHYGCGFPGPLHWLLLSCPSSWPELTFLLECDHDWPMPLLLCSFARTLLIAYLHYQNGERNG